MAQVLFKIGYRPLRIGWCIKKGDIDALRTAMQISYTMWGGSYNPIIPIDDPGLSDLLIDRFPLDLLHPAQEDNDLCQFAEKHTKPASPLDAKQLFSKGFSGNIAAVVDIFHPLNHIADAPRQPKVILPEWKEDDPLALAFLAELGRMPQPSITCGINYPEMFERICQAQSVNLTQTNMPKELAVAFLPNDVCQLNLKRDYRYRSNSDWCRGIFVGASDSFDDILTFWNLRCADIDLYFYDPRHHSRISVRCEQALSSLRAGERRYQLWFADEQARNDFGDVSTISRFDQYVAPMSWPDYIPPRMIFDETTMVVDADRESQYASNVTLPPKPIVNHANTRMQHLVTTVHPITDLGRDNDYTFFVPDLQELNEWVGRNALIAYWKRTRVKKFGFDVVMHLYEDVLFLRPFLKRDVIQKTLEVFGIKATVSKPGLAATRIIKQMGGVQGCRIFKIAGVREVIRKFGVNRPFVRTQAQMLIGNVDGAGKPHFEDYEDLIIGQGRNKLKPEFAFDQLVEQGVFRVGLQLDCPNCELNFFIPLDELATVVPCDYCAERFNTTRQLKHTKKWSYKANGLFAAVEHQHGAIPVAVTMQQLDTSFTQLLGEKAILHSSMELKPLAKQFKDCETDIVLLGRDIQDNLILLIGECKANDEITDEDVEKLTTLAECLPHDRIRVYILFSKLSNFSEEEVERCRKAQAKYWLRVILWSKEQLEPYMLYERAPKESGVDALAAGLDDMAAATAVLFFKDAQTEADIPHNADDNTRATTQQLEEEYQSRHSNDSKN